MVSVLAVNDTFTASVENDIANQINQMHAYMNVVNPNATSTASGGPTTWVTMGNVTVPAWATKARISLVMCAIAGTTTTAQAEINVKIGTSSGAAHRVAAPGVTTRFTQPINDLLTSVPTGSQSVVVQATFASSTLIASSTVCIFDLNIDWMQ